MTNRERLLHALFDHEGREHIDVKFFPGTSNSVTSEQLCGEAVSGFFQIDQGLVDGDDQFEETFHQVNVAELAKTL
jgi:hypothetical protein